MPDQKLPSERINDPWDAGVWVGISKSQTEIGRILDEHEVRLRKLEEKE